MISTIENDVKYAIINIRKQDGYKFDGYARFYQDNEGDVVLTGVFDESGNRLSTAQADPNLWTRANIIL